MDQEVAEALVSGAIVCPHAHAWRFSGTATVNCSGRDRVLVVCLRENVTVRVPSLTVGVQWEVLRPIEDPTPNPDCKGGDVLTIWLRHATSLPALKATGRSTR